jgi:hypothetical protein
MEELSEVVSVCRLVRPVSMGHKPVMIKSNSCKG